MSASAFPEASARLLLADLAATRRLAERLAKGLKPGDVIGLSGVLGAGKTTFARAVIQALGGAGEVPSPAFTLVQTYELDVGAVWHFDLYRLESPGEAHELAIEDAFAEGISLIEWPEKLGPLLPDDRLDLNLAIEPDPGARRAHLTGYGPWAERLSGLADDVADG